MKDPSPANWFERLFDKGEKSVERRMLMATMIGVFITAISSVLSLIVSSYQAYLGYQQLKGQAQGA
jgi:ABC-type glycerol-3-phosphate transport system permease component